MHARVEEKRSARGVGRVRQRAEDRYIEPSGTRGNGAFAREEQLVLSLLRLLVRSLALPHKCVVIVAPGVRGSLT